MSLIATLVTAVPDELRGWMEYAVASGASDLHLVPGHPPVIRKHGDLVELPDPPLDAEELQGMLRSICSAEAFSRLVSRTDIDFSFGADVAGSIVRFRANLFREGGRLAACLRVIPSSIPDVNWAGFPADLAEKLAFLRDGLIVLTGATGSGKTTTLAMIVNLINKAGGYRIITVEEPVEYVFPKYPNSVVTQREVGRDVPTFADGLKYGLRQDPDVILVGEVRDRETAQMALSAAETGHLVFATLHTRDAKGAITRFPDLFPADAQKDVRSQLAMSLRTVVSQRLLPGTTRGAKRHLAVEVLWNTHPIANAIRNGKVESIDNYILTGREEGMIGFDETVRQLYRAGKITKATAEQNVSDLSALNR
ncbi:MAG TPA: PilT/PilU family type 4a pilus ATPase [Fimbriiglobus sp.]|jgi:twitching motility protein PilT